MSLGELKYYVLVPSLKTDADREHEQELLALAAHAAGHWGPSLLGIDGQGYGTIQIYTSSAFRHNSSLVPAPRDNALVAMQHFRHDNNGQHRTGDSGRQPVRMETTTCGHADHDTRRCCCCLRDMRAAW
jgi:hypothetical protein